MSSKAVIPDSDLDLMTDKPVNSHAEALRQQQAHTDIDPQLDKRLDRKSNLGNAKIDRLTEDLSIGTGDKFNVALLVFLILYILIDVPALDCQQGQSGHIPHAPDYLLGTVCTFMGFTRSYGGLVVSRLLLGLFGGGLLGGILVYLAMFYRKHQMLHRIGPFSCAAPQVVVAVQERRKSG
ncbi:putative transporter-like protein [Hapsidospora chrysogenum ATCC 11550]|uniref:Putative transporter-like protein n=1 Tax=Hapsidospora chrysogenum (strain ATCC 11550 / CBS 779.69 / DSM 880 / IAM 14645 / JCM 23072 / IMI 49137) TaxID=857340 RepID=A0A086T6T4_HAPC1|nr:putative transporter-like protein [Hapsidospora chrysogenum ATCC 11550]